MLKVVVLTREQPAANYLVNVVSEVHPIHKVYFESWDSAEEQAQAEAPPPETFVERIKVAAEKRQKQAKMIEKRLRQRLEGVRERQERALTTVFGHRHKEIEPNVPVETFPNKAWDGFRETLLKDPPDVVLVFGNSLIPDHVTEVAKIAAINIHTGLSPHYRGQNCTKFAIINEDFENIGVTVHLVRKAIDGGEIIVQRRPEITPDDDEETLNCKTQRVGAEIYCDVLERLKKGERFKPVTQPKGIGLLLMNRALTAGHNRLVRELIEGGAVHRYLKRKERKKTYPKPILEELQMGPDEEPVARG